MTPLHICLHNENYELFEYLVHTANADVNVAEEEGDPTILQQIEQDSSLTQFREIYHSQ